MDSTKQQAYWDEESSSQNYFKEYLDVVAKNGWTDMFQHVEQRTGVTISGNVLEIGGGSQYLARHLCARPGIHVTCTDISDERIRLSNLYYKTTPANLITMGNVNAQRLPFEDEQFDFIIGDAVLHHIEDLRSGLYEINRCLKPNGKAIFIREPVLGIDLLLKRKLRAFINKPVYEKDKLHFVSENRFEFDKFMLQWNEEFYRAGFRLRTFKGWYFRKAKDIMRSRFPYLFTSLVTFHLSKTIETKKLNFSHH